VYVDELNFANLPRAATWHWVRRHYHESAQN